MMEKSNNDIKNDQIVDLSIEKINQLFELQDNQKLLDFVADLHSADISDIIQNFFNGFFWYRIH